jgi:hypothetical protein
MSHVGGAPSGVAKPPRTARFEARLSVRVSTDSGPEVVAITTNVSRTGPSAICGGVFPHGARVTLLLSLDDKREVRVGGDVTWSHPVGNRSEFGVRITNANETWVGLLNELARKREVK